MRCGRQAISGYQPKRRLLVNMQLLDTSTPEFGDAFESILRARQTSTYESAVSDRVAQILADVRERGDNALLHWTRELDRIGDDIESIDALEVSRRQRKQALARVSKETRTALQIAAKRIRDFHERQKEQSWEMISGEGIRLAQRYVPLEAVGVYVPGGTAAYPSSVLMNVIPAHVAGVDRITMVTPTPGGNVSDVVIAAAELAGVDQIFRIGGAQAIAALAYGTQSIAPVHKIVGPGNIWVATAKRLVFGAVDIDMIAGPTELCIIATDDGGASAEQLAADLLSQAEHDTQAMVCLMSPSKSLIGRVMDQIQTQLPALSRCKIAREAVASYGLCIHTSDINEALTLSNRLAPEHLQLVVPDADNVSRHIRHAGAIFCGPHTPEAIGDYVAGPNHVLPTNGSARFFSPLGVQDFVKRINVIRFSKDGLREFGPTAVHLAELEGLDGHAKSIRMRLNELDDPTETA
jgi:histidinol dehydrogenase